MALWEVNQNPTIMKANNIPKNEMAQKTKKENAPDIISKSIFLNYLKN